MNPLPAVREVAPDALGIGRSVRCGAHLIPLDKPLVMGILNVTSDSFYRGCRALRASAIARRAEQIAREGAQIIDIGACSTRPGSLPVPERTEMMRLRKAIAIVRSVAPAMPISIDTYRANVAEAMLKEFGGLLVNDIASGGMDARMFDVVATYRAPYILTHIQGTPTSMQRNPQYGDVVREVCDFFAARVERLRTMGVCDLILDPGFGFGKTLEHNYTLLRNLQALQIFNLPILAGISRKSMVTQPLGIEPADALPGTQVLDTLALVHGASILRVHDVRPAVEAVRLFDVYSRQPRC